jgi:hypothetical protein
MLIYSAPKIDNIDKVHDGSDGKPAEEPDRSMVRICLLLVLVYL